MMCLFLTVSQCSQTESKKSDKPAVGNEFPILLKTDSLSICWEPPSENPDSVASYELYYRLAKDTGWTVIKSNIVATKAPCVTVYHKDVLLVKSAIYFAVRSVGKNGTKSDLHHSTDKTASPVQWLVIWE
jgi:hypothetical protein